MQDINARIAGRVRALRAESALSLEALATRCNVSRSMISLVERGETSPTAVVLEKIATGLGCTLASLFDDANAPANPVSRGAERTSWKDPQSGYVRRNISPPNFPSPIRIVEVAFPAGARVSYETGARELGRRAADLGAAGRNRSHGRQGHPSAGRRRLPGHAARRTGDVSQSHAQDRALRRRAVRHERVHMCDGSRCSSSREFGGLCEVLIDCVEGGASVSFMHPMTLAKAADFWREVAASMARGERALLVAEDERGAIIGTAQVVWAQPENQPHRADVAKMLVHRRARRLGVGAAVLEAAERAAARRRQDAAGARYRERGGRTAL